MDYRIRPELKSCPGVVHGGILPGEVPEHVDFSVCVNPFPLPRLVQTAVFNAPAGIYPDTKGAAFLDAAAKGLKETGFMKNPPKKENLLAVNGTSQGIFLIAFALLERGDRVLIAGPTYGEYEKNCRLMGAEVFRIDGREERGYLPCLDDLVREIETLRPRLFWICNPNNPTGHLLDRDELEILLAACRRRGCLPVIDQAYLNFVPQDRRYTPGGPVVILRSMTKDFGLAGLRLGYVIGPGEIIRAMAAVQPQWSLNSQALAAGEAVWACLSDYRDQWKKLEENRDVLVKLLGERGIRVYPSVANFFFGKFPSRLPGDDSVQDLLARRGLILRDCRSFGMPGYFRAGVSTRANNIRLAEAFSLV